MRRLVWTGGLVLGVILCVAEPSAWAVIMRLMPLREVLSETDHICMLKIERLDPDKPAAVMTVEEDLKGKAPFRRLPMNLTGDSEGQKLKHTPELLKRLAPDLPLALFATKRGKRYTGFFYTNGTWFQALGVESEDAVRWSFTHCEPYLRRTFKGTTAELRQIILDNIAGKSKPPEPDPKEPPGLGPEVQPAGAPKKSGQLRLSSGPVFAVIPTVLAGPLALLALLFPAVFGGLMLTMRRWFAGLSAISFNSTLYLLHDWFQGSIRDEWWGSPLALWCVMTLIALFGTVWAWRRHRVAASAGQATSAYGRLEQSVLWGLTLVGVCMVGYAVYQKESLLGPMQKSMLVIWLGIWAGTLTMLGHRLLTLGAGPPGFSAESAMLVAMLAGYVGIGAATWPRGSTAIGSERIAWEFRPKEKGQFLSSPLVAGKKVFIAAAHAKGFATYGVVYCLDRETGEELWKFTDDDALQQVFSTPTLEDGKLYIGEGLHQDKSCKLFCLDGETGKKLWEFATNSHVESSPMVKNGRVFFGAGDDGLVALDAATGKRVWQFNQERHIDAGPVAQGNRIYVGSGVSRAYRTTEVFCLDAESGQSIWRMPVDLPAWGTPLLVWDTPLGAWGRVVFGLGNGNLLQSDPNKPAGAVLCLEAETGKRVWRRDLPDGVLTRPAVNYNNDKVYCTCRDGKLYCFDIKDGRTLWEVDLHSPLVSAPALRDGRVYAASSKGFISCLDAASGEHIWKLDLAQHTQSSVQVVSSPAAVSVLAKKVYRYVLIGASVGSDIATFPVLYCLEDW